MRRPTGALICAVGLALVLGGCQGAEVPGNPTVPTAGAVGPSQPPAGSDVPAFGAPKVDNPLDTSRWEAQPCETLTDDQVVGLLGTDTEEVPEQVTGPSCRWGSFGPQSAFVMVLFPKVTDIGLSGFYRAKGDQYKFFKEMPPVRGYPSIAWDTTDESTVRGECNVVAGTSDRATVNVSVTLSPKNVGKNDPCEAAHEVLDMVIGNIQGAN